MVEYGQVILVTLAYMEGWTDVKSYGLTVTETKFSRTDGSPKFLSHGAPRARLWRTELRYKLHLHVLYGLANSPRTFCKAQ